MSVSVAAAVLASKAFARSHRWSAAVAALAWIPLEELDAVSVGRLQYALMMAHRADAAKAFALLERVVRRNGKATPELCIELAAMATSTACDAIAAEFLQKASAGEADPHIADTARKLLILLENLTNGRLKESLKGKVGELDLSSSVDLVTLVPVSGRYLNLWRIWLRQTRKHVGGTVVAMAMDHEAHAALRPDPDVATVDVREFFSWSRQGRLHPRTRDTLWLIRVLLLRELARSGRSVLVLDLDAIALGDLAPMLAMFPEADVIAQQDDSIPMDVRRQLGFVLCCGFMLWRPTLAARELLDRLAEAACTERDDQLALNHLIAREGIEARRQDAAGLRFRSGGVSFACPAASMVSRALTSGSVIRHFHQHGQTMDDLSEALGLSAPSGSGS